MPSDSKLLRLHMDVQMTRRKRWHYVANARGLSVFASHRPGDCFEWLALTGEEEFLLVTQKGTFHVAMVTEEARRRKLPPSTPQRFGEQKGTDHG